MRELEAAPLAAGTGDATARGQTGTELLEHGTVRGKTENTTGRIVWAGNAAWMER